jgi:hypothetical protein
MNFLASSISSCMSGSSHPGSVLGAPGRSLMMWFQIVCLGSLCDSCSENILLCHWYLTGMFGGCSEVAVVLIVTFPMKYWSWYTGWGLFLKWGTKWALFAFAAYKIIGSYDESIHPCFQLICSCVAANHEYPNIALLSPRFVRKNCSGVHTVLVCTSRSV